MKFALFIAIIFAFGVTCGALLGLQTKKHSYVVSINGDTKPPAPGIKWESPMGHYKTCAEFGTDVFRPTNCTCELKGE